MSRNVFSSIIILGTLFFAANAFALNFSSDNFTITTSDTTSGERSTSASFSLTGAIGQFAVDPTSSAAFELFGGIMYFPFVTTPVVAATAGNSQVVLTWTSANPGGGWNIGGYSVGQSTVQGGPYSYVSVGNVLTSTKSSLTNGTAYYFVIRATDSLGNVIATSTEVSATPVAPASTGGGGGGGGGGGSGGGTSYGTGAVNFSGRAYPRSIVTLLKDAQIIGTVAADSNANFSMFATNLSVGNYLFSFYSEDNQGNRSSLLTFPVSVTSGVTSNIGGIFIAPTIAVDKSQVRKGDDIAIFGQTSTESNITIQVNSDQPFFAKTISDSDGIYLYNFDTSSLEYGDHSTKSKTSKGNEISSFSLAVPFVVGTTNIAATKVANKNIKGDINADGKVNLVDFSIAAFWYNRPNPVKNADLNGDGKVNLIDFSILAYNWTG